MSDRDIRPEDALEVAQRALTKVNDLEDDHAELEAEYEDTVEEVTALKLRLSEISEERPYDTMGRDEKIGKVREHAFNKAAESATARAALDYDDIMWGPFDGEPSADFCYKLMKLAADTRGFDVRDHSGESRKLVVNAEEAKRSVAFSSANKTSQRGTES